MSRETYLKYKDTYMDWGHTNTNQKRARIAILISDRTDFRARKVIRDKEGHYIIIKG